MKRMINLRVTHVSGCPRAYQNGLLDFPKSPPHFTNLRGNFIHYYLEQFLIWGRMPTFKRVENRFKKQMEVGDVYLEMRLAEELTRLLGNLKTWFSETKVDLSKGMILGVEKEYKMPIVDNYRLVGHIDLLSKTHIIDFKTGFDFRRENYLQQLGAYRELALYEGYGDYLVGKDWVLADVFLGGAKPVEHEYSINEVEDIMPEYYGRLDKLIGYDREFRRDKGFRMPCEVSQICSFCDFRGGCQGI